MGEPYPTGLKLYETQKWPVDGHVIGKARPCDHDVEKARIEVRKIGWLDQKGNVWLSDKDWMDHGGPNGSITPLLIADTCD
jgi:hypothetical protein